MLNKESIAEKPNKQNPLDIRATLTGIARRWPLMAIVTVGSWTVVRMHPPKLSKAKYEAETILEYQPSSELPPNTDPRTALQTLKDTVKLRANLEEMRHRLRLKQDLPVLGKAIDVHVQKNTMLLVIGVEASTPRLAAAEANTLRDVFLGAYLGDGKHSVGSQVTVLTVRLDGVRRQLKEADRSLQQFTSANHIVDIQQQAGALLNEYNNVGVLQEQARGEMKTVEQQSRDVDKAIAGLKAQIAKENTSMNAMQSIGDIGIRIDRLRQMIADDRQHRANVAELTLREKESSRNKILLDKGYISRAVYDKSVTAYEVQKALTEDTAQIDEWKAELTRLQQSVRPAHSANSTPSSDLLQRMLLRTFEIQLERIGVTEKLRTLTASRQKVRKSLDRIPILQRQFDSLRRNITALEMVRKDLEARIAQKQRLVGALQSDFTIVEAAQAPELAPEPKFNIIGIVIGVVGTLIGVGIAVALELMDRRIRTVLELSSRTGLQAIGALRDARQRTLPVSEQDTRAKEAFSLLAQRIRKGAPKKGARIALVAATHGEGTTTVAANLAACLAGQGECTLLMGTQTARHKHQRTLSSLLPEGGQDERMAEYLGSERPVTEDLFSPGSIPNLFILPCSGRAIGPDLVASQRMTTLLQYASEHFDVVLLDVSPVLAEAASEILIHKADSVVMVVQSGGPSAARVQQAAQRLQATQIPLLGAILNRVPRRHWRAE